MRSLNDKFTGYLGSVPSLLGKWKRKTNKRMIGMGRLKQWANALLSLRRKNRTKYRTEVLIMRIKFFIENIDLKKQKKTYNNDQQIS